jgi:two-component system cell cycle response regulator
VPFQVHGARSVTVTVSIGVSARQAGDASPGDLLKRADVALYQAKNQGRNQVVAAAA